MLRPTGCRPQRLAQRRRHLVATCGCRSRRCGRVLPQPVELPVHRERRPVRHLDLAMHRPRRLRQLPEPVLERWSAADQDRAAPRRVDGVALSPYGVWSDDSDDPALNTSGINFRYGATEGATHFVVDTSRNGQGRGSPMPRIHHPRTGATRLIAVSASGRPGRPAASSSTRSCGSRSRESDGLCHRGTGGPEDPARGMIDPPPGNGSRRWHSSWSTTPLPLRRTGPRPSGAPR